MGYLDDLIEEQFNKVLDEKLEGMVLSVLRERKYEWFWFVKEIQYELMRHDRTLTGKDAWFVAIRVYRDFLRVESASFGDERFDWSKDGARTLAHECEIYYWERI